MSLTGIPRGHIAAVRDPHPPWTSSTPYKRAASANTIRAPVAFITRSDKAAAF